MNEHQETALSRRSAEGLAAKRCTVPKGGALACTLAALALTSCSLILTDVISYVRTFLGHQAGAVTPQEVNRIRANQGH